MGAVQIGYISYALQKDANINGYIITGIDSETGNLSCVASIPDVNSIESSFSGIFAKDGIFYFMGDDAESNSLVQFGKSQDCSLIAYKL